MRRHRTAQLVMLCSLVVVAPAGAQARWTFTPDLRIGSVDDEAQSLTNIGGVALGRDGRIYIAQPQDQQIRVYTSAGKLQRIIGRKGAGPGEFEGLGQMNWRGDTLVVYDIRHRRLSLFAPDGELARILSIPLRGVEPLSGGVDRLLPDGKGLATPGVQSRLIADGTVKYMPTLLVDSTGAVLDTVLLDDVSRSQFAISYGSGGGLYTSQRFSDAPIHAQADGGFIAVQRDVATTTRDATFRLHWIDYRGDTLRTRSYRYTPRPIPKEHVDSVFTAMVKSMESFLERSGMTAREYENALRAGMRVPRYFTPIVSARIASTGEIWLDRGPGEPGSTRYNVLSAAGDVVAVFDLPRAMRIVKLHGDHLYAAETDALDVPYLVRYRINRTR